MLALAMPEELGAIYEDRSVPVPTSVYRYVMENGQPTPYIRRVGGRTAGEVYGEVYRKIRPLVDEYFHLGVEFKADSEVPRFHHIAAYAVTGGSEGHYIHVDLYVQEGMRLVPRNLFLGKTFRGIRHARKIAGKVADLLGA